MPNPTVSVRRRPYYLPLLIALCAVGITLASNPAFAQVASSSTVQYVVKPMRISPLQGQAGPGVTPYFREPYLLLTHDGHLVTVFMEIPPSNTASRFGWSCVSTTPGFQWSCYPISRGAGGTDFADAWITDSRGDACSTYGNGLTLAALRASSTNVLQPIAYYSPDFGQTWVGPDLLPWPPGILADGSKTIFTGGHLYVGWRDFTFGTGQYISRLGTSTDACQWSQPNQNEDGQDHIRFAASPDPDGFASLGNIGTSEFTFHRWLSDFSQPQNPSVAAGPVVPGEPIYTFCKSDDPTCDATGTTSYELAQTLMYDPDTGLYHLIFNNRPTPTDTSDIETFYTFSRDAGVTWSSPVPIAGSGAPGSNVGAATVEPMLVRDPGLHKLLAVYYEKPTQDSDIVELRYRILQSDGTWSAPIAIDQTPYAAPGNEERFGDYFGAQANNGFLYVVHHPIDSQQFGYIAYLAVRY